MSGRRGDTPIDRLVSTAESDLEAEGTGGIDDLIEEFFGPGIREAEEIAFLPRLLVDCDYFIDVGANIGQYTIVANQHLKGAQMLAIEANPRLRTVIERLVSNAIAQHPNGNQLTVETAAILDDARPVSFFITDSVTTSSLFAEPSSEEMIVRGRRLDEFYRPAHRVVVKMDIEGAEYRALRSADKFLSSGHTEFFLELHGWGDRTIHKYPLQVLHLLLGYGYAARKIGSHYHFFRANRSHRVLSYARVAPLLYAKWLVHRFAPRLVPLARRLRAATQ